MLILIWLLNFVLSALNAWGCGKSWNETKATGGMAHFLNWMGAVMSASGFTWCYTLLACFLGGTVTHQVDGKTVAYLSQVQIAAVAQAGYLLVILPILGSGFAIGIHSWVYAIRHRSLSGGAVAGYNTFANVYNAYEATRGIPSASKGLGSFFKSDDAGKGLVLLIVLAAAFAGILTTYTILTATARATLRERALAQALRST